MRPIDADALKEEIMECMTAWDEHSDYGTGRLRSYEWVLGLIDKAPTVEPTFKPIAEVSFSEEPLKEIVDKAMAEVLASMSDEQAD